MSQSQQAPVKIKFNFEQAKIFKTNTFVFFSSAIELYLAFWFLWQIRNGKSAGFNNNIK